MKKYFADLKPFFNQRIIYPKDYRLSSHADSDFDNYYIYEEDLLFNSCVLKSDVAFVFQRDEKSLMDSVACDSQKIDFDGIKCSKILVAGLSTWGSFNEEINILFDDSSITTMNLNFPDWWRPLTKAACSNLKHVDNVFRSFVCKDRELFIYYCFADFGSEKILKRISLPDNILMSIFAITLMAK